MVWWSHRDSDQVQSGMNAKIVPILLGIALIVFAVTQYGPTTRQFFYGGGWPLVPLVFGGIFIAGLVLVIVGASRSSQPR